MNKINMQFLSSILVLCVFGITNVHAAPSVRMLGTNTARIGMNNQIVKPDTKPTVTTTGATQRLGNIRTRPISAGTPVSVTKTTAPVSANESDAARLSLGKYIHSSGVAAGTIKPATSNANVSSDEIDSLVDRVQNLENNVEEKQDALIPGDGLVLDNGAIALDEEYAALPATVNDIQTNLTNNYYTIDEVDDLLDEHVVSATNTIYDSATGERKYVSIVDDFSDEILN